MNDGPAGELIEDDLALIDALQEERIDRLDGEIHQCAPVPPPGVKVLSRVARWNLTPGLPRIGA